VRVRVLTGGGSVEKLAHDIVRDFGSQQLTVLCVLKVSSLNLFHLKNS
jgi:hypothetical protein